MQQFENPVFVNQADLKTLVDISQKYFQEKKTKKKAISFTTRYPKTKLITGYPLRNLTSIHLKSITLPNPFIRISTYNSLLYLLSADAIGGTSLPGSYNHHYMLVNLGSYSVTELVEELNALLKKEVDPSGLIRFAYDSEAVRIQLINQHATRTVYVPSNVEITSARANFIDRVKTIWPTLGFVVADSASDKLEIRSINAVTAAIGVTPARKVAYEALNVQTNSNDVVGLAYEDFSNSYAILTAQTVVAMPYNTLMASTVNLIHADETSWQSAQSYDSKRCIYVLCPEIATNHIVASAKRINGRMVEDQPQLCGLIAKIPILDAPGGLLTSIDSVEIQLDESPMNRLQSLRLNFVDESGNDIDFRGFTASGLIEVKCKNY